MNIYPSGGASGYPSISGSLNIETGKGAASFSIFLVKRSEQAANLQSLARKSNIRMFLMPEMNMDEEKSLSYAAGELKRSHLTAVVLLCDPKHISRVMDEVRKHKKLKYNILRLEYGFLGINLLHCIFPLFF